MNYKIDNIMKIEIINAISSEVGTDFILTDFLFNTETNTGIAIGKIDRYGKHHNIKAEVFLSNMSVDYWEIIDNDIVMNFTKLGSIRLGSKVVVSDPCYERDTWCAEILNNARKGLWNVYTSTDVIDSFGYSVYILELLKRGIQTDELDWIPYSSVGVDSGQMSVFDDNYYRNGNKDKFYTKCCNLTIDGAGIYLVDDKPIGVVCSSGHGDGVYALDVKILNEEIVAMKINFM